VLPIDREDEVLAPEQVRGKLCNRDTMKKLAGILNCILKNVPIHVQKIFIN